MSFERMNLGRYCLLRLIGRGGMGEVYLADDTRINRGVAIKVIRSEVAPYPEAESAKEAMHLFEREARAIANLDHPNILPLFDFGECVVDGMVLTYMVMPYYADGSLEKGLRLRSTESTQTLSLEVATHVVTQAASALQYAHNRQIIHQDVKPQNFLIRGWKHTGIPDILLSDFGVAKFLSGNSNTSQSIRGTPTYMAPEQWQGHPVPATDQYALAIMMYQLLTGHFPFQGGPSQMMYQHFNVTAPALGTYMPQLPEDMDVVLQQALAKKPEERFASVAAFARAFQQAAQVSLVEDTNIFNSSVTRNSSFNDLTKETVLTSEPTIRSSIDVTEHYDSRVVTEKVNQPVDIHRPTDTGKWSQGVNETFIALDKSSAATGHRALTHSKWFLLSLVVIAIVLVFASVKLIPPVLSSHFTLSSGTSAVNGLPGTQVAHEKATGLSSTSTAVSATATSTIATATVQNLNATATAQTNMDSSATATTAANQSGPFGGTLALSDPLVDNSQGHGWEVGERDSGFCTFTGGSYHTQIPLAGYFHSCLALATDFSDFAYEVQMTIISGNYGGIVFRADRATTHFYYFLVDRSGNYTLKVYFDKYGDSRVVTSGSTGVLNTSLDVPNLIGVVAHGSSISLYINQQLVTTVSDDTFSHGQLGIVTLSGEAAFSNAKVWTF